MASPRALPRPFFAVCGFPSTACFLWTDHTPHLEPTYTSLAFLTMVWTFNDFQDIIRGKELEIGPQVDQTVSFLQRHHSTLRRMEVHGRHDGLSPSAYMGYVRKRDPLSKVSLYDAHGLFSYGSADNSCVLEYCSRLRSLEIQRLGFSRQMLIRSGLLLLCDLKTLSSGYFSRSKVSVFTSKRSVLNGVHD
ncbi:hypothetical protein EDD21DRAFT_37618 [Dissophora ornata]|nr:hypothetical protein EDD21DRAFT_37618 [Dissophora ornata]